MIGKNNHIHPLKRQNKTKQRCRKKTLRLYLLLNEADQFSKSSPITMMDCLYRHLLTPTVLFNYHFTSNTSFVVSLIWHQTWSYKPQQGRSQWHARHLSMPSQFVIDPVTQNYEIYCHYFFNGYYSINNMINIKHYNKSVLRNTYVTCLIVNICFHEADMTVILTSFQLSSQLN